MTASIVIVAGSRDLPVSDTWLDQTIANEMARCFPYVTTVVSGTARGVDQAGERWAMATGLDIVRYPANWNLHGRAAGSLRNAEMAAAADGLLAIWDGKSRGTKDMILKAVDHRLQIRVVVMP